MLGSLIVLRLVLGSFPISRWYAALEIVIYGVVGIFIYLFLAIKNKLLEDVFSKEFIDKLFHKKRK